VYLFYGFVIFLYCGNTNLVLKYPVFPQNVVNIYIYIYICLKNKKIFSCVLHTANTLTCFERFLYIYIKETFEVLKMCFRMDFLNTTKKLFSCISGFYNMFVKLQRVLANIPKNTKILFWGNSSIIHR